MQLGVQSVAVVTGAGNGVGQAIACPLAKCGCRLVLVDIDHESLDRTRKLLADCTASFHALDVAKRPAIESLAVESRMSAAALIFWLTTPVFHWLIDLKSPTSRISNGLWA